ncbi:hypothetical protein [Nocardia sp. NPDC051570]|uniref:hypothetical protein n=1 Tax=Nocardia sp. NPDC051570 TaxID=3364324 RepID=UPI00378E37E5
MLDALTPVCEPAADGAATTAFGSQTFPAFYLIGPDAVTTTGTHAVRKLPNTTTTPTPAHH